MLKNRRGRKGCMRRNCRWIHWMWTNGSFLSMLVCEIFYVLTKASRFQAHCRCSCIIHVGHWHIHRRPFLRPPCASISIAWSQGQPLVLVALPCWSVSLPFFPCVQNGRGDIVHPSLPCERLSSGCLMTRTVDLTIK